MIDKEILHKNKRKGLLVKKTEQLNKNGLIKNKTSVFKKVLVVASSVLVIASSIAITNLAVKDFDENDTYNEYSQGLNLPNKAKIERGLDLFDIEKVTLNRSTKNDNLYRLLKQSDAPIEIVLDDNASEKVVEYTQDVVEDINNFLKYINEDYEFICTQNPSDRNFDQYTIQFVDKIEALSPNIEPAGRISSQAKRPLEGVTDVIGGSIKILETAITDEELYKHILAHEIGHAFGFKDDYHNQSTVMAALCVPVFNGYSPTDLKTIYASIGDIDDAEKLNTFYKFIETYEKNYYENITEEVAFRLDEFINCNEDARFTNWPLKDIDTSEDFEITLYWDNEKKNKKCHYIFTNEGNVHIEKFEENESGTGAMIYEYDTTYIKIGKTIIFLEKGVENAGTKEEINYGRYTFVNRCVDFFSDYFLVSDTYNIYTNKEPVDMFSKDNEIKG